MEGSSRDVHDTDQSRADLAREPDALRLAARQGLGGAVQLEVVQADIFQESQTLSDFLEDPARDLAPCPNPD